ncbi:MAG: hypothetical protein OJF49_002452 [Ktedonobacterales bacterium]|nr:MAG: hypothetical protein OJF49_002452 [Ktedonobacterales bacterium]
MTNGTSHATLWPHLVYYREDARYAPKRTQACSRRCASYVSATARQTGAIGSQHDAHSVVQ